MTYIVIFRKYHRIIYNSIFKVKLKYEHLRFSKENKTYFN